MSEISIIIFFRFYEKFIENNVKLTPIVDDFVKAVWRFDCPLCDYLWESLYKENAIVKGKMHFVSHDLSELEREIPILLKKHFFKDVKFCYECNQSIEVEK